MWLKAERDVGARLLDTGSPQARDVFAKSLPLWRADVRLAPLRDQDGLARLPHDERESCQAFWKDVDDLLKRSER
jgi:hypothetical protein